MGNSVASGYADAIDQGLCSLDSALAAHLQSNHYPPLPLALVSACVKAIHNCEYGNSNGRVQLPTGMRLAMGGGRSTNRPPSWRLVEAAHLDAFINMGVD